MKKRILALLLCLLSLFSLASCGEDLPEGAELPEGMQYAGGEPYGFYLYVPEEWTLSSMDSKVGAFVSNLDISSVSLTSVPLPIDMDVDSYFKSSIADVPFDDFKLEKDGISRMLGKKSAKGYEFTYSYLPYQAKEGETNRYRVMQLLCEHENRLYIFTYTALDEKKMIGSDTTYFQTHIEDVGEIIDHVQFVKPQAIPEVQASYEKDADGYLHVATKRSSGFHFYMDPDWKCTMNGGIVEVVSPDGNASINITESRDNGVSPTDYFAKRKSDLERYTEGEIAVISKDQNCTFGDADTAWSYEYTYSYRGEDYHTYQVLVIDQIIPAFYYKGYVFTFTATEDSYATHLDAVKKMIAKVDF